MKNLLLFSVLLFGGSFSFSQCPANISLFSQEDIDNFSTDYPNCTGADLRLVINGQNSNIQNLNGLSVLTLLESLELYDTQLTNFQGLNNLSRIFVFIRILNNDQLIDFSGMDALANISGFMDVYDNNLLSSFDGLDNLGGIDGKFVVGGNIGLQSLSGLNNLTNVGGTLSISNNLALEDISGLESLELVGSGAADEFRLFNNPSVTSLLGLENLTTINGNLRIEHNNSLESIAGLSSLESVIDLVKIRFNGQLTICSIEYICMNLTNPDIEFDISNNLTGCDSIEEIEAACTLSGTDIPLADQLLLFPNPVSEILQIHTSEGISLQKVTVYSLLGKELIATSEETIDFSTFSNGIYFVKVVTNSGNITKKIVKE